MISDVSDCAYHESWHHVWTHQTCPLFVTTEAWHALILSTIDSATDTAVFGRGQGCSRGGGRQAGRHARGDTTEARRHRPSSCMKTSSMQHPTFCSTIYPTSSHWLLQCRCAGHGGKAAGSSEGSGRDEVRAADADALHLQHKERSEAESRQPSNAAAAEAHVRDLVLWLL